MPKPKVFVFSPTDTQPETYRQFTDYGCDTIFGQASWHTPQGDNEDDMCSMAQNADALTGSSIRSSPITAKIMREAPNLRIVAKCTIGVDDVDLAAATAQGVLVTNSPVESNWGAVAEGAMAIMLALTKKTREKDEAVKRGEWRSPRFQGLFIGRRHDGYPGLTIGLVGLGRIGRRLAGLLAPWRVRILAYDPYVPESRFIITDVKRVDLPTLLKESDIVSLHVILTDETRRMIGAEEFDMMKPGVILVNTSRGQVVDEKALIEALKSGKVAAAGLDVFEDEPLPSDSPLLKMGHQVLLSPHMVASNASSSMLRMGVEYANNAVVAALRGEVPENVYNPEVIARWRERFGGKNLL
jgi:phosphoglycerate dehydrogenase-like enzyme